MNDPNNPFKHGTAKASSHDRAYEEMLAREAARKDENARIFAASLNRPVCPAPAKSHYESGSRALYSQSAIAFAPRSDISVAEKAWNVVWKSCGVALFLLLLAALGQ
jgi:hypothetical protein